MPPVAEALREVLAFLATQHVDYMVMGGLAVRVLEAPPPPRTAPPPPR